MTQCSMQQLCSQRIQAKNDDSVFYATTMFTKNTSQELCLSVLCSNYVHKECKPIIMTQCSMQQLCSQRIQTNNYDSVFYATTMFTKNTSQELWISVLYSNFVHKEYKPRIMTQRSMQQLCSQRIQEKNYDSVFYAITVFTKNTSQGLWLSVLCNNYVHKEYKPIIMTQYFMQQLCSQRIQAKNYDSVFYATTMFTKNTSQDLWLSVLCNNYVHKEYKPRIMTRYSLQLPCSHRIQAKNYDPVFYATTMFTKNTSQGLWLSALCNNYVHKEYKPTIITQCSMQQLCSQWIQAKNYDSVFYATTMFTKNTSQEWWLIGLCNNYVHKEC